MEGYSHLKYTINIVRISPFQVGSSQAIQWHLFPRKHHVSPSYIDRLLFDHYSKEARTCMMEY